MSAHNLCRLLQGCAVVGILLLAARLGVCARQCGCDDITTIKSVLDQAVRSEAAWDVIVGQIELGLPNAPQTTDQAIQQFKKEVWPDNPDGVIKSGGLDKNGEPVVNPEVEKKYCKIIVDAIALHEHAHHVYFLWSHLWESITASSDLQRTLVLAGSEADAYAQEAQFLQEQLEKLEKECEKPRASLSPDEEQTKTRLAQQKHVVTQAATRVAAYANGLK